MKPHFCFAALILLFLLAACERPLPARPPAAEPAAGGVEAAAAVETGAGPSTPTPTRPEPSATAVPSATPAPPSPTISPPTATPQPTEPPITTLLFVGNIVPARCVQEKIDQLGNPDYPYEEVSEIIQSADYAVGVLNATMSDAAPRTGCWRTWVLVGDPENADAMARAGFDMMSVATNHIMDCGVTTCGYQAFFDTLDNLRRVGIVPVGAGADHAEAMQPAVVELNGTRFGFVSLGQLEQGGVFAGEDKPGIAVLNNENLRIALDAARAVSDVVIAMPHWGPEDVPWPNWLQRDLAREWVAAGADLVVGNHTHVVQGIQEIDGVQVFYGLGNFVFDQGLTTHRQAVILKVYFRGAEYAGYEFLPTHVDGDGRVHLAGPDEALEILAGIEQASRDLR